MNAELFAVRTVSGKERKSKQTTIPPEAFEALGEPERIVWMLDRDTGRVYVAPQSEVTVK